MSKATCMDAHGSHKVEEFNWKLGGQPIGAKQVEEREHVQAPYRKIKVNMSLQALNAKGHFTSKPHFWSLHKKRFKRRKGVRILVSLFFCEYEKRRKGKRKEVTFL